MSWVGTHRNDFFFVFFFSYLSRPSPTYFGLERSNNGVFLIFLNFFATFFEFSITGWVGTHWNDFFCFFVFSFSAFSNLFWLGKMQQWCFLIFFEFFAIFSEFSITGRVGTHWNDFFFSLLLSLSQLIFSLSRPSPTYFASKRSHNSVFYFFGIVYGRNSSERFFFFSFSRPFPTYFGLKSCQNVGF